MGIGKQIRKRRTELGMTQEELAKKCCYGRSSTICDIEKGRQTITGDKVRLICTTLGMTPNELFGYDDWR